VTGTSESMDDEEDGLTIDF